MRYGRPMNYYWEVRVKRNGDWATLGVYASRDWAAAIASDTPGVTRVVRGDPKPAAQDCTVCGTWECADCGASRAYTDRAIDHCLSCGSQLGRMKPMRHHAGSRVHAR